MREKPRGLIGAFLGTFEPFGTDALLAAARQLDGLKPPMQEKIAFLENGADADGELALAAATLLQAHADLLLGVRIDRMNLHRAARRAMRRAVPDDAFNEREGGNFIVEIGFDGTGTNFSLPAHPTSWTGLQETQCPIK